MLNKLLGIFSGFSSAVKIGVAVLAATAVVYPVAFWHGGRVADADAELRGARKTIDRLIEKGQIDEAVKNLDDCQLTIELGGVCDGGQ